MSLQNASVVVTGGARGIGRFIAHTFAREGANVAIADIDLERLDGTVAELKEFGVRAIAVPADVRDEEQVAALMDRAVAEFGRLDVVVNNAAIVPHFSWGGPRWPPVKDMELAFYERVMDTNLTGTFLGTKHAFRHMVPQGSGHVLNLFGGGRGPGAFPYVVSKHAIRTFSAMAAEEVRDAGVFVATVYPGAAIATEDAPEEARRRMPGPEIVANRFVLAAQAPMELSGRLLDLKDGELVVDEGS